jgi:hypothetical protein
MKYIVTDRDNKDRENPIVESFDSREEAEKMVAESSYGDGYAIEEWEREEDAWFEETE